MAEQVAKTQTKLNENNFTRYYTVISTTIAAELVAIEKLAEDKAAWDEKAAILRDRLRKHGSLTAAEYYELGTLDGSSGRLLPEERPSAPPKQPLAESAALNTPKRTRRGRAAPHPEDDAESAPESTKPARKARTKRAVEVKREQLSICVEEAGSAGVALPHESAIKKELLEAMPAPRAARKAAKTAVVDLEEVPMRVTRSKKQTRNGVGIQEPSSLVVSDSDGIKAPKLTLNCKKSPKPTLDCKSEATFIKNETTESHYEDAESGSFHADCTYANGTYITYTPCISNLTPVLNATVVLEKPVFAPYSDLMTDEDSDVEPPQKAARKIPIIALATKQKRTVNEPSLVKQKDLHFATQINAADKSAACSTSTAAGGAIPRTRVNRPQEQAPKALRPSQRAHQQRELLEAARQRALDALRLKEEHKARVLAELKEERRRKQRLEERERRGKKSPVPVYMCTKEPLLPSYDCFDSDDEHCTGDLMNSRKNVKVEDWAQRHAVRNKLAVMYTLGEEIKNTFFTIQAQTPDLQDIFEVITPSKLTRKSSAIWLKQPRFTMIPRELLEQALDSD